MINRRLGRFRPLSLLDNFHTVPRATHQKYIGLSTTPVFICEAGAIGSHSELPEEFTEPFLDLNSLLSAFIHARYLSTSEAVTVVHSRVVEARHCEKTSAKKRLVQKMSASTLDQFFLMKNKTEGLSQNQSSSENLSRQKLNSLPSISRESLFTTPPSRSAIGQKQTSLQLLVKPT